MTYLKDWRIWVIASLTLGLAPFYPEPHIVGKIKWVAGGANGMSGMDWFDLFFHGTPWLGLFISLAINLSKKKEGKAGKFRIILITLALAAAAFCTTVSLTTT